MLGILRTENIYCSKPAMPSTSKQLPCMTINLKTRLICEQLTSKSKLIIIICQRLQSRALFLESPGNSLKSYSKILIKAIVARVEAHKRTFFFFPDIGRYCLNVKTINI